jgi:ubiquinone/menaquinone biosynthesis C-methylase UbiE
VRVYYDRRAPEYDDWYLGEGRFAWQERPGWSEELAQLAATIRGLTPGHTLDVGCGTGFLTRHLRGEVTALDQSRRMLAIAGDRLPEATLVRGEATDLPFAAGSFDRVFTSFVYGHLQEDERTAFLLEARRVAKELVVVDASHAHRPTRPMAEWQERVLGDGSSWRVYKRYFTADGLRTELGGGVVLHDGNWFVAVCA